MAFIRCRQSNRAKSYQVVETYREGCKVRQRVLANLGPHPTIDGALREWRKRVALWQRLVDGLARPPGYVDGRFRRYSRKAHEWAIAGLARRRAALARIEAISARRDLVDTTPEAVSRPRADRS